MEAAVVGVELGAMSAVSPGDKRLQVGKSGAAWHVALVLTVGQNPKTANHIIFDPSTVKDPVELNRWFSQLGYPAGGPEYVDLRFGASAAFAVQDTWSAPILWLRADRSSLEEKCARHLDFIPTSRFLLSARPYDTA